MPLTYYHRTGPIGQLMGVLPGGAARGRGRHRPGDRHDGRLRPVRRPLHLLRDRPRVKAISYDQDRYFSYVQDAKGRGAEIDMVLGDARLSLDRERREGSARKYDAIVVDAFSSDAIPVHLMTLQALRMYRARLKDEGVIAFHTSNHYLSLEPVVANLAAAEGMACLMLNDEAGLSEHCGRGARAIDLGDGGGRQGGAEDFGKLSD